MQIKNDQKLVYLISAIIMIVLAVVSLVLAQNLPEGYRNIPGMFQNLKDNFRIFEENNSIPILPYGVQFLAVIPAIVVLVLGFYMGFEIIKQKLLGEDSWDSDYIDTAEIIIGAILWIASTVVLVAVLGKILFVILTIALLILLAKMYIQSKDRDRW